MSSPTTTTTSSSSPLNGTPSAKRHGRRGQFEIRNGLRHHSYDREKAPYPLAYSPDTLELEPIDLRLFDHLNNGSCTFVDFSDASIWDTSDGGAQHPERSLDLGCGTGSWIIDAAKEWPECEFVGFDLVDVQIPLQLLSSEYESIAERITWVHGNFLTNKLPFEEDEFDLIHVHGIALGVPESKWGNLLEEINRVLRPGGVIELVEEDIIFPRLPKWFTSPLRARPRRSTSVHLPSGTQRGLFPPSDTQANHTHDHALLESLFRAVFESRFINLKPTAILPSYFTTYFRHVKQSPVVSFYMPPLPPLQPLPPQIITSYVVDPNSDTLDSRTSTIFPNMARSPSVSFSSVSTGESSIAGSVFTRPRRKSSVSTSDYGSPNSDSLHPSQAELPKQPSSPKTYTMDVGPRHAPKSPDRNPIRVQLDLLNERSLAMHLYRSHQIVLACQEEMWEELKDRIWNRKDELKPFGWDDDEELEELQSRKKFELLVTRYRHDMQTRIALWCSLTGIGWQLPPREPLSKAELIEEERMRAAMLEARAYSDFDDDPPTLCRSFRVLVGCKM
ncbi:unnamed protein product [Mycena citricolor]|uniref:Methyltransferase domain-containing protein n=1 Tax=Mycena citricolor TaxID=2018698 RepID=A0AAD2GW91_9AGAR|nr:unnamed protein product [Mycena citricolor]